MKVLGVCATWLLLIASAAAAPTHQFDHFFPGWNELVQLILHENCTAEYDKYLTGHIDESLGLSSLVTPVINCILEITPEFRKAEMASSAVILGLTPTVLQQLGSTTGEMALLSLRRPVLSLLLAAGSPAVSPTRAFEYDDPIALLSSAVKAPSATTGLSTIVMRRRGLLGSWQAPLISVVQYVLAFGAIGNVVNLGYELGVHAIVIFSPETIFQVPLWTFLAVLIHLVGALTLWLRVRVRRFESSSTQESEQSRMFGLLPVAKIASRLPLWMHDEVVPAAHHGPTRLEFRQESILFVSLSWLVSIGTVLHVLYGTLVLSSLLFFSVVDSLNIVGRYAASVIVCRSILMYELAGMRSASRTVQAQEAEGIALRSRTDVKMADDRMNLVQNEESR